MNGALLHRLRRAAGDYVPFEALADVSDDPGRDLDAIEAFGFGLERHPILGVAYRSPADRLCPDQIEHGLEPAVVGRRVAVWSRVGSTNDLGARAAQSSANEGLVILAEEQTAGRGRRGRSWVAPARSSILLSAVIFPKGPLADPSWLTALGAVAAADVVRECSGADARIKWPNDVRVGGRKIAGVLVERGAGSGAGAVVGIGLNANLAASDLPPDLRDVTTSLLLLVGDRVDRSELAVALIRRLDGLYDEARRVGPLLLGRLWADRSEHLGREARVVTKAGAVEGLVSALDLSGGVTIRTEDGRLVALPSADVLSISNT